MSPVNQPSARILFKAPTAERIASTEFDAFRRYVNRSQPASAQLRDYWEVHAWTLREPNAFWTKLWDYMGLVGEKASVLFDSSFPIDVPNPRLISAKLNYAENLLLSHANARSKTAIAITSVIEPDSTGNLDSTFLRSLTYDELYIEVRRMSRAMTRLGVKQGDRIVAFSPNNAEAAVAALAAATLGAVFSSCPSEFGTNAVLERFSQIEPTVVFTADSYRYAGKKIEIFDKLSIILKSLPTVRHVVVTGHLFRDREPRTPFPVAAPGVTWSTYNQVIKAGEGGPDAITFERFDAMIPVYILFSSGTTGKPKALLHGAGPLILSQKMSNQLHSNISSHSTYLQFSTLGWMMWNLSISCLASGAHVILYDGSPLSPMSILWDLVERHHITTLGISPRYLQALNSVQYRPNTKHDLSSIDIIATTGSPLKADLYDWIREHVGDVWINNGSGGTDICGVIVATSQVLPIYYGELQVPALGMAVEAWNDNGEPVLDAQGEMVITQPFPNMPLGMLNDEGGARYHAAYFEEFPGKAVWNQGDWMEVSSVSGGSTIFGRSDGVLNPSGVRFGSAELYDVVEEMKDVVEDCIAVGQKIEAGADERVILFVKPKGELTDAVIQRIRKSIAAALSPRHVPAVIISCPLIPYTTNGKKLEVACKKLVNGIPLKSINISAAEVPAALNFFINHPALRLDGTETARLTKAKL